MDKLGWDKLDIILVTGDAYIDSSFIGVAIIGKVLANVRRGESASGMTGYKVGIIGQPDILSDKDITRLGEPELFWGITGGAIDSMVANRTALQKPKRKDDFTPGGINNKRPERATIIYSNLIRKYFKNTRPLVLGGLEASMRRIAHYDYWDNDVRRSILFDAKADVLVYGMAEKSTLALADRLKANQDYTDVRGICYISKETKKDYFVLPSYEEVKGDKTKFIEMFNAFYENNDPITSRGLCQKQDTRYLIQNPPSENMTTAELDQIYDLDYERDVHPYYGGISRSPTSIPSEWGGGISRSPEHIPSARDKQQGEVKALATIRFSITSHRGCYGECNFCSITVHQGRTVVSRSAQSILKEAEIISKLPDFKGYILDVGGPTANMYGIECAKKLESGACAKKRCIYPEHCAQLPINHHSQIKLLSRLRQIPGIKKVFIGSGIRYDMLLADQKYGKEYLKELIEHHISGQLKIAPKIAS